jgi:Carboxypeptidase regulatory-like domain
MHFQTQLLRSFPIAVLCAVAFTTFAFAQLPNTSGLHGTVTDQTGGVVAGASVTLQSGAAQKWTTTTNEQGDYGFEQVPPGRYTVMVEYPGFLNFSARVDLRPQVATSLDVRLKIGISVVTDVRVKEQPGLSTDPRKNLSGLILTGKDIAALPDDPQRLLQRLLEMAGSTGRPGDVAVLVDGFREHKPLPPKSTIEMIRVNSNPWSAEFSQPGLDRIEIITKPGSDSFHGEVRLQGGDSALDARNPLAETKPETRNRSYNGHLQGPIIKGRLDFLLYAGQWHQDENAVVHATVLEPATSLAQPFATAVSTPTRVTSAMLATNFRLFNQRINVSYTKNDETRRNQGLEGGFDLPERAYDGSSTDGVGRLWWTSMGRRAVNDLRFELTRSVAATTARLVAPAVLVLDAFNAGGNQNPASRTSTLGMQGSETLTVQQGRHAVKAGIQFENIRQENTDRSGFGGTFIFGADVERDAFGNAVPNEAGQSTPISPIENYRRTVLGRPGYAPSEFWIVRGNPEVGVEQWTVGWFALDDWSLSNRMTLSYGVRQEQQNNLKWRVNLAPRAVLSWVLDANRKNLIRLGSGIFYGRVEPGLTLETRKVNGTDRQQLIIERPSGFPAIPASLDLTPVQSAIYTKADDLRVPYAIVTMLSYERQLPWRLYGVGQYTLSKGVHLLRLRNLTAPVSGASDGAAAAPVLQFESTGRSLQRQVMLGLRGYISTALALHANYTFSKKHSDTDGAYTTPANSRDVSIEYGPAADDQRHQFVAGGTAQLPGRLSMSPSITVVTGRPFNITTGRDNNGDTIFSDRPAFARDGDTEAIDTRFGLLSPNPQPGDIIVPRNLGREPRQVTVNLSVSEIILDDLIVTIDADNVLNTRRLIRSNGVLTSPEFGQPNQALNGRRLLLTVRYGF